MTKVNFSEPNEQLVGLLSRHPLFRDMPSAVVAALAAPAGTRQVAAGAWLFREGDRAQHCYMVADGTVEMLRYGADGTERVFKAFGTGQLVAEWSMFMPHGRYPMNARAVGELTVYGVPREAWQQACASHSPLAMRTLAALSERLYRSVNEVEWLTASTAPQRLAAYLLEESARQGGTAIELPLSQRQLAGRLGMRAETLSRLFSDWVQSDYLSGKQRHWVLTDLGFLRELASASVRSF